MDLAVGAVEFLGCFFFFFQLIDSIGGDSRVVVAHPSVDISAASGDGNLKEIRGVPQLASFAGVEGD